MQAKPHCNVPSTQASAYALQQRPASTLQQSKQSALLQGDQQHPHTPGSVCDAWCAIGGSALTLARSATYMCCVVLLLVDPKYQRLPVIPPYLCQITCSIAGPVLELPTGGGTGVHISKDCRGTPVQTNRTGSDGDDMRGTSSPPASPAERCAATDAVNTPTPVTT
jgi:hypothetical protein